MASDIDPVVPPAETDVDERGPAGSPAPVAVGDDAPIGEESRGVVGSVPDAALGEANEADLAEQLIPVPLDEDDYR